MRLGHVLRQISILNPGPTHSTRRPEALRSRLHELVYEIIHRQIPVLGYFPNFFCGLLPDRKGIPAPFRHRSSSVADPYNARAAIIAIFQNDIRRYLNRPIIEISFKNEEPWCRDAIDPSWDANSFVYYYRVKITNNGKTTAKKCEGKINSIQLENGNLFAPFDPIVLDWVGHKTETIEINRDEHEFLGLLSVRQTDVSQFIISADDFSPNTHSILLFMVKTLYQKKGKSVLLQAQITMNKILKLSNVRAHVHLYFFK
jgi:hypothetical protein